MLQTKPASATCLRAVLARQINALLDNGLVPYVFGPSGVGKTYTLTHCCGDDVFVYHLVLGQLTLNAVQQDAVVHDGRLVSVAPPFVDELNELAKRYRVVVLFLDELDKALVGPLSGAYVPWVLSLLREKRVGAFQLADNVRVVTAGNMPIEEFAGGLNEGDLHPLRTRLVPVPFVFCGCKECVGGDEMLYQVGQVLKNWAWMDICRKMLAAGMQLGEDALVVIRRLGAGVWGEERNAKLLDVLGTWGLIRGDDWVGSALAVLRALASGRLKLEQAVDLVASYPLLAGTVVESFLFAEALWHVRLRCRVNLGGRAYELPVAVFLGAVKDEELLGRIERETGRSLDDWCKDSNVLVESNALVVDEEFIKECKRAGGVVPYVDGQDADAVADEVFKRYLKAVFWLANRWPWLKCWLEVWLAHRADCSAEEFHRIVHKGGERGIENVAVNVQDVLEWACPVLVNAINQLSLYGVPSVFGEKQWVHLAGLTLLQLSRHWDVMIQSLYTWSDMGEKVSRRFCHLVSLFLNNALIVFNSWADVAGYSSSRSERELVLGASDVAARCGEMNIRSIVESVARDMGWEWEYCKNVIGYKEGR